MKQHRSRFIWPGWHFDNHPVVAEGLTPDRERKTTLRSHIEPQKGGVHLIISPFLPSFGLSSICSAQRRGDPACFFSRQHRLSSMFARSPTRPVFARIAQTYGERPFLNLSSGQMRSLSFCFLALVPLASLRVSRVHSCPPCLYNHS